MFLSRVQLLGTPWRHRRLRRSAAVRQDASSPSLWSQNRHLLVSAPSFLHDGHFPGTVRNSMFSPIRLLWCKKKKKKRARKAGRSQKNKHANSDHFTWSSIKVFRCTANPSWWAIISLQECRRTRVIFYSGKCPQSTQDALWLRHSPALHCCNHVYVL